MVDYSFYIFSLYVACQSIRLIADNFIYDYIYKSRSRSSKPHPEKVPYMNIFIVATLLRKNNLKFSRNFYAVVYKKSGLGF